MAGGSLISWAVFREGTAESWVRGDLETLLAVYRPAGGGSGVEGVAETPERIE